VKSPKLILANSLPNKPDISTRLSLLPLPPDDDNIRLFLQPPSPLTIVHPLSEQVTKLLANGPSGEIAESKLQHALSIPMWRSEILRRLICLVNLLLIWGIMLRIALARPDP
jgi:hypothetical protein